MLSRIATAAPVRATAHRFTTARFASTLVVADHDGAALAPSTLNVVTAAKAIGGDVDILVAGASESVAAEAAAIDGVTRVLHTDDEAYAHGVAENMTGLVLAAQSANSYSHILAAASNAGKNWTPRVAVKLDVAPVGDVTKVLSESKFERPMYAGNAIAEVESTDAVKVLTIRPTGFDKAATGGSAPVEAAPASDAPDAGLTKFVSEEMSVSDRPSLGDAKIVVSGGRGMKSGDNFVILEALADKLGAAVGASRAAVDSGFCPNDMQVGQTGKVVAPELYIAAGISGAIQHIAGMKDSKTIVVINKDEDAPFFQLADYGLVADLFKAVPELTEKI